MDVLFFLSLQRYYKPINFCIHTVSNVSPAAFPSPGSCFCMNLSNMTVRPSFAKYFALLPVDLSIFASGHNMFIYRVYNHCGVTAYVDCCCWGLMKPDNKKISGVGCAFVIVQASTDVHSDTV